MRCGKAQDRVRLSSPVAPCLDGFNRKQTIESGRHRLRVKRDHVAVERPSLNVQQSCWHWTPIMPGRKPVAADPQWTSDPDMVTHRPL
jgi:hypothetical protein